MMSKETSTLTPACTCQSAGLLDAHAAHTALSTSPRGVRITSDSSTCMVSKVQKDSMILQTIAELVQGAPRFILLPSAPLPVSVEPPVDAETSMPGKPSCPCQRCLSRWLPHMQPHEPY